jgi:methionyl-tRNA synthetase
MVDEAWITAMPPTPNGRLHVGHLAGPYIAADVFARFVRAEGAPALLTSGLDENQNYVVVRARQEGRGPEDVADDYCADIQRSWSAAELSFDRIGRPRRDAQYVGFVQRFFSRLVASGDIVPHKRPLPYCAHCRLWLFDGYVAGDCPYCGEASFGGMCELCSRPNDSGDVIAPHCRFCDAPAEVRACERLYLPLAPFTQRLEALWSEVEMPPHMHALCEQMLADGLPDVAVSHPTNWGVPLAVPGFEDQRMLPLCEMAPAFLLQHDDTGEQFRGPGPIHFFGFDNGYFQAALIPALYTAYDATVPMPTAFVVNEFYRLEGSKFSTTRRHVVTASEALDRVGSDVLRFHVLADRPTGRQTSFSWADVSSTERRLQLSWNGWLDRLFAGAREDCDGVVPAEQPSGIRWSLLMQRARRTADELREAYSLAGFDPRRATVLLDELVSCANDFGHEHEHTRHTRGKGYRAAIAAQLVIASALAAWAEPVLPNGAARLASTLGLRHGRPVSVAALAPLPAGAPLAIDHGPIFGSAASGDREAPVAGSW